MRHRIDVQLMLENGENVVGLGRLTLKELFQFGHTRLGRGARSAPRNYDRHAVDFLLLVGVSCDKNSRSTAMWALGSCNHHIMPRIDIEAMLSDLLKDPNGLLNVSAEETYNP